MTIVFDQNVVVSVLWDCEEEKTGGRKDDGTDGHGEAQ